jgi:Spy/CpxP family protein refolding chaperone
VAFCCAAVFGAGLLICGTSLVEAQSGRGILRTGLPQKKRQRPARQMPVRELTEDQQSEAAQTGNPQSPDDRLIPLGIGPRQRIALLRVFNQLNLSADQRTRLAQLRRETGNRLMILNKKRQLQNEELEEALYGANFDPQTVEQKAADLGATTTEMIRLQARILSQIRQIMTPEQALRFRELLQEELRRPNPLQRNP